MRITLNLATRPFADLGPAIKHLRIAMAVLAVVAIGLGLGLRAFDQKAKQARARDHSLDGQIAQITRERQSYQDLMRQPDNAKLLGQIGSLNRLFDEKTFSWTLAIEDLETVLPGGVQVSSLEPVRAKDGHITLRLRVVGPRDKAVDLVRNLEHSKRFLLPRIVGENAESQEGPAARMAVAVSAADRVDFDLLAEYKPALPGERMPARKPSATREDAGRQPSAAHPPAVPTFRQPPPMDPNRFNRRERPPYTGPPQSKPNPSIYTNTSPGGTQ